MPRETAREAALRLLHIHLWREALLLLRISRLLLESLLRLAA